MFMVFHHMMHVQTLQHQGCVATLGGHAYSVSIFSSRSSTPYPHCLQVDILCVDLHVGLGSPNDRKQFFFAVAMELPAAGSQRVLLYRTVSSPNIQKIFRFGYQITVPVQ